MIKNKEKIKRLSVEEYLKSKMNINIRDKELPVILDPLSTIMTDYVSAFDE